MERVLIILFMIPLLSTVVNRASANTNIRVVFHEALHSPADDPLTPHFPVVYCDVDDVTPLFYRLGDCVKIKCICPVILFSQISTNTYGGCFEGYFVM